MRSLVRPLRAIVLIVAAVTPVARATSLPASPPTPKVAETPSSGAFPLATASTAADLIVDDREPNLVPLAAGLFAADVASVTGHKPALLKPADIANGQHPAAVIVGTLGRNALIDSLAQSGKLDVSPIKDRWEAFTIAVVPDPAPGVKQALVIAGSDRRGAAYGLFTLSQAIGVSPWYWWADVPPAHHAAVYLTLPPSFHDAPAVKYRGIFINDEDWGMHPWASKTFDPQFGNIGPKTYAKVFELMLRLRLNYIWPAMHGCSTEFGSVPENVKLADDFGIVAGASHCEPMLYNNVKWDAKAKGPWNYLTNRDTLHATWEETAKARGNAEAVWTLGIRGIHDRGMETPPDDMPGKIDLMGRIIHDQRELLARYVTKQWGPAAQCFVPYKEVLPIYDAGLKVPDDVTLVWVDDNFGYIRRFSNPEERQRPGGAGVYYHISYYGSPHSYTWINTTAPALMWEELHKAWDNDARTLWVLNVGDIKPMEIGIDYFSQLAWNADSVGPDSQPAYLHDFAARTFGESFAQPIADILTDFYRLGTVRKPELMDRQWALSLPADRAEQLRHDYEGLLNREQAFAVAIPPELRDAYFETVAFPVRILGSTGLIFMADRNVQQGIDVSANQSLIELLRHDMTGEVDSYNTRVAGGKWKRMMPGLVTGKILSAWNSQVRWPWGEKAAPSTQANSSHPAGQAASQPAPRTWRDAATADRRSNSGPAAWRDVPGLGPSGHAVALLPATLQSSWPEGDATAPSLAFDFTAPAAAPAGDAEAFIDFLPTFRTYPGMKLRVSVAIDNQPPTLLEVPGSSGAEDERGKLRQSAVQDNYARARVPLPALSPGQHTLTLRAVDPGVVIDRISLP